MMSRRDHPLTIPNLEQLDAYLTGELSARERAVLDAWVAADPRHAALLDLLRRTGSSVAAPDHGTGARVEAESGVAEPTTAATADQPAAPVHATPVDAVPVHAAPVHMVDVERAWHAVAARTYRDDAVDVVRDGGAIAPATTPSLMSGLARPEYGGGAQGHGSRDVASRIRARRYAIVGACAAALVLAAAWHWRGALVRPDARVPVSAYATANGQRAVITLADGSRVMLNVASRIEVPTDFSRTNRTVRLYGEALFTVSHDGASPFTVIAGPSTTRVLGTSFVVRHYDSDTAATITVRDGKVAVQSTIVAAMQQVAVGHDGVGMVEPADTSRFSFASGVLTFTDMPLIDAVPALNRWYDVDIRLGDPSLATRKVVGGFKAGSPTDLMMMLGWTFNIRVVQDGRILTLYPKTR